MPPTAAPGSNAQLGGDILSRMPKVALLMVLKSCASLQNLLSLLHASPAASRLFHERDGEIVESLIRTTLPPELQPIARSVSVLRTADVDHLPFSDYSYKQVFVVGEVGDRVLGYVLAARSNPRMVLAWAHRIARLELAVLQQLILFSMRFLFEDPNVSFDVFMRTPRKPLLFNPAGNFNMPFADWKFFYGEPYRVRGALWRIASALAMSPNRILMERVSLDPLWDCVIFHQALNSQFLDAIAKECQGVLLPGTLKSMTANEHRELSCVYACLRLMLGRCPLIGIGAVYAFGGGEAVRRALDCADFRNGLPGDWDEIRVPHDGPSVDFKFHCGSWEWNSRRMDCLWIKLLSAYHNRRA